MLVVVGKPSINFFVDSAINSPLDILTIRGNAPEHAHVANNDTRILAQIMNGV
jgi:hypothetical protein